MPTTLHKEDLESCFSLDRERRPEFRALTLDGAGTDSDGKEMEAGLGFSLLCRECASNYLRDSAEIIEGEVPSDTPMLGIILLPLRLSTAEVESLREEITEAIWTTSEN